MNDWTTTLTILGMAAITVLTRSFFFLSDRPWHLPSWARRGLAYAPVAALAAVIAPEILLTDGHPLTTWHDARLFAVLAGVVWYRCRRGVLGTILAGMAVYLPLHLGAGW
jgi:branched-subunit amino acid transport protein